MLLYFRFYGCSGGKFITLTVFNYERTVKTVLFKIVEYNRLWHIFTKLVSRLLSVRVSIYTQLSVVITAKFTTQFSIAFTVPVAVHFGVWAPFQGYHWIQITSSSKILSAIYSQTSACKFTQQKQTRAPLKPSLLRSQFKSFFETAATIFKPTLAL